MVYIFTTLAFMTEICFKLADADGSNDLVYTYTINDWLLYLKKLIIKKFYLEKTKRNFIIKKN